MRKFSARILAVYILFFFLPVVVHAEAQDEKRFIKLDEQARELADDAPAWMMVKDNRTGLIWEVKTDDSSIHNKDSLYSWKKSTSEFIKQLNRENFGGFSDWRLPEEEELGSLLDKSKTAPYIDERYFPLTMPEFYLGWALCGDGVSINSSKIHFGEPPKDKKKTKQKEIRVRAVRGKAAKK